MINYLMVFLGGGIGSMARFYTSSLMSKNLGVAFPWGTLCVDLIGAFLIGLVIELLALKMSAPAHFKYLLVTGFLGGFTTFSAFSLETASMWMRGDWMIAILYVGLSVIGTVALVLVSTHLLRLVIH